MLHQLPLGALGEHLEPEAQQQVFQNVHEHIDRLAVYLAFTGHLGGVQQRCVREAYRLQEPGEVAHVADQAFGLYFLTQVKRGVRLQCFGGLGRAQNQGKHPQLQASNEVET